MRDPRSTAWGTGYGYALAKMDEQRPVRPNPDQQQDRARAFGDYWVSFFDQGVAAVLDREWKAWRRARSLSHGLG